MLSILLETFEKTHSEILAIKNKEYKLYYDTILDKIEDLIIDYIQTTRMTNEEVLRELEKLGANKDNSFLNNMYLIIKGEQE